MISLQRLYKLAARAHMASYILARYSWCNVTKLSDSQRLVLTSMKFRLMAVLSVSERKGYGDTHPIPVDIQSYIYFLGFWQKDRLALIRVTIGVIDIALRGRSFDRYQCQQATRYLDEVSLYAWKDEMIRITNKTDQRHLSRMLDLVLK